MKWLTVLAAVLAFAAGESPAVTSARHELERVRGLVAEGALPAAQLAEAQQNLDDATDADVLEETLYARIEVEDLTEAQASDMIQAAERRVTRQQSRVQRVQKLLDEGVVARAVVNDPEAELDRRQEALKQAQNRASLVREIVGLANAEIAEAETTGPLPGKERVDGAHLLAAKDLRTLTLAFEKEFAKPLPVSARGSTAVHRALGLDHTGRIDVAVTPDSPEGIWLRKFLAERSIPYYVFRVSMPGKATAPHIHIGPGSTRLPTGA
jgi:multidrug resistance efflux pump